MEITERNRRVFQICMTCYGCLVLMCMQSCLCVEENVQSHTEGIHASEYPLFTITPDFSISAKDDTLYKQYPRFQNGKEFPLTGTIEVDGKAYRFMGGDSLRPQMVAPVSVDSSGWSAKYSFLHPGKGWEQPKYDDSRWKEGKAMFGTEDIKDANTCWSSENIYIRRMVTLNKKEIRNRKLYIRYSNDDECEIYVNGQLLVRTRWSCHGNALQRIPNEMVESLKEGKNVIAAHCLNRGGPGLIDFGIYAEDTSNRETDVARLKSVNMGATQTHYNFQCGKIELALNFIAPLLPDRPDLLGYPINYLAYHVKALDKQTHAVKISFDLDQEWMFGKTQTEKTIDRGWKAVKTGRSEQNIFAGKEQAGPSWGYLYMGMKGNNIILSDKRGHIVITQELGNRTNASDVLLIGFDELCALQYFGENLPPYWKRNGKRSMEEELKKARKQYKSIKKECERIDDKWMKKAMATGGIKFAEQYIPSYRSIMASYRLAETPDRKPVYFGYKVGSTEESYALAPKLLFFERIELVKGLLNPVFDYSEKGKWAKRYPAHDVGTYPIAIAQVSEKDMPVTDAADMLMLIEAVVAAEKDPKYAKQHWERLSQWGEYLNIMTVENEFPVDTLVEMKDDRAKKALGLSAYRRLSKWMAE